MKWLKSRAGYVVAVLALAVSGGGGWWLLSQDWIVAGDTGLFSSGDAISGAELYPVALAGCWVVLALILAIVATSGWVRRSAGVCAGVALIPLVVAAVTALATGPPPALTGPNGADADSLVLLYPWALLAMAAVGLCGAVLVVLAGAAWPGMSRRQSGEPARADNLWDSLDKGVDPTE